MCDTLRSYDLKLLLISGRQIQRCHAALTPTTNLICSTKKLHRTSTARRNGCDGCELWCHQNATLLKATNIWNSGTKRVLWQPHSTDTWVRQIVGHTRTCTKDEYIWCRADHHFYISRRDILCILYFYLLHLLCLLYTSGTISYIVMWPEWCICRWAQDYGLEPAGSLFTRLTAGGMNDLLNHLHGGRS